MNESTYIDKLDVVATLRSRGLHDRANWGDRALPALLDTVKTAARLRTLGIDDRATVPSRSMPTAE